MTSVGKQISKWKKSTWASMLSLVIPGLLMGLWINAFNRGENQDERVELFYAFFPEFLHGKWRLSIISITFCFVSVIFSTNAIRHSLKMGWLLNLLILAFGAALLALNIFTLL
jgi:hypothetical protein